MIAQKYFLHLNN